MFLAVVVEPERLVGLVRTITGEAGDAATAVLGAQVPNVDVVERPTMPVVQVKPLPNTRQQRLDVQPIDLQAHAEQ
jgi:hypothetical protein